MTMRARTTLHPSALLAALFLALGATACEKPSEEACRQAVTNMQRLLGTDRMTNAADIGSAVRRCRGASKKAAVECAIAAPTFEELQKCTFYREAGGLPTSGAPTTDTGSAGSGSAAP